MSVLCDLELTDGVQLSMLEYVELLLCQFKLFCVLFGKHLMLTGYFFIELLVAAVLLFLRDSFNLLLPNFLSLNKLLLFYLLAGLVCHRQSSHLHLLGGERLVEHACYLFLVGVLQGFFCSFPLLLHSNHILPLLLVSLFIILNLALVLFFLKVLRLCQFFGHTTRLLNFLLHFGVLLVQELNTVLNHHGTLISLNFGFDKLPGHGLAGDSSVGDVTDTEPIVSEVKGHVALCLVDIGLQATTMAESWTTSTCFACH